MSRIFGFIVGALLVFGGLYYLLTPTVSAPASVEAQQEDELTVPASPPESASAAEESPDTETTPALPPAPPPEPAPVQLADQPFATDPDAALADSIDIADEQALVEQALPVMQVPQQDVVPSGPVGAGATPRVADGAQDGAVAAADTQWFAVWDPFHSELSANAFARRLERMTGLDYRVVRSGPAKYEVAVAFRSEQERVANIAIIEEATGLRIAGGSL